MRRAFTLVEALAATALGAMLMFAALSTLRSLAGDLATATSARGRSATAQEAALDAAFDLVGRDLRVAALARTSPSGIEMSGYGMLSTGTLRPTHTPAAVTYRVERVGTQSWLVREQTDLGSTNDHDRSVELVLPGVSSMKVVPVPPTAGSATGTDGLDGTPPQGVRVVFSLDAAREGENPGLPVTVEKVIRAR